MYVSLAPFLSTLFHNLAWAVSFVCGVRVFFCREREAMGDGFSN